MINRKPQICVSTYIHLEMRRNIWLVQCITTRRSMRNVPSVSIMTWHWQSHLLHRGLLLNCIMRYCGFMCFSMAGRKFICLKLAHCTHNEIIVRFCLWYVFVQLFRLIYYSWFFANVIYHYVKRNRTACLFCYK